MEHLSWGLIGAGDIARKRIAPALRDLPNYQLTYAAHESQNTLQIFGTTGSIHVPILNGSEIRIKTADGERAASFPPNPNVHQPLIEDFTRAVLENREPRVSGATGKLVAELEEKIYADS